jgi:hypothetical protein
VVADVVVTDVVIADVVVADVIVASVVVANVEFAVTVDVVEFRVVVVDFDGGRASGQYQ